MELIDILQFVRIENKKLKIFKEKKKEKKPMLIM